MQTLHSTRLSKKNQNNNTSANAKFSSWSIELFRFQAVVFCTSFPRRFVDSVKSFCLHPAKHVSDTRVNMYSGTYRRPRFHDSFLFLVSITSFNAFTVYWYDSYTCIKMSRILYYKFNLAFQKYMYM